MKKNLFKIFITSLVILGVITLGLMKKETVVKAEVTLEEAVLNTTDYDVNGDGAKDPVYEISTVSQFYWFANYVNNKDEFANAILLEDITLNEITFTENGTITSDTSNLVDWINYCITSYSGDFNGNGKTISGLYSTSFPLFRMIREGANVHNLNVVNAYVNGSNGAYISILAYYNQGTIDNCYVQGFVKGGYYCGGIVGYNGDGLVATGIIKNCIANVYVKGNNSGNICGLNYKTIENCLSIGGNDLSYGITYDPCGENNYYLYGQSYTEGSITYGNKITEDELKTGEITWKLNKGVTDGTQVFYQTVGSSDIGFSGDIVYYGYTTCTETERTYSNEVRYYELPHKYDNLTYDGEHKHECSVCHISESDNHLMYDNACDTICNLCDYVREIIHTDGTYYHDINGHWMDCAVCGENLVIEDHKYENSVCIDCGRKQDPILITEVNCESLGLSEDYIGYYVIANLIQLRSWAENNKEYVDANVVLIDDIWIDYTNPISIVEFNGIFDGNGYVIGGNSEPLIWELSGTIKNLGYSAGSYARTLVDIMKKGGSIINSYIIGSESYNNAYLVEDHQGGEIINSYDVATFYEGTQITYSDFASGKVAYLLNNGLTDGTQLFYQEIGVSRYPIGKTHTVYCRFADCNELEYVYSNNETIGVYEYHNLTDLKLEVPSTCFENGNLEHYECFDCGIYFDSEYNKLDEIVIKSCNHKDNNFVKFYEEVTSLCFVKGTIAYYHCENCDVNYDEELNVVENITIESCYDKGLVKWVQRVSPTLTSEGHTSHYYCEECDLSFDTNYNEFDPTIERLHDFGSWVIDEKATTEEEGHAHRVCSECGKVEEKVLPVRVVSNGDCKVLSTTQIITYLGASLSAVVFVLFRKRK